VTQKKINFGWLSVVLINLGLTGSALAEQAEFQPVPSAEAPGGATVAANVTLASEYVARGFQQSWGRPALQGSLTYVDPSGFFAGTWMSTVSPKLIQGGHEEVDLFAGYGGAVGDVSYVIEPYYYLYPGAELKPEPYTGFTKKTRYDYGELLLGATWQWLNISYWYTYTRDYFGYNSDTVFCNSVPDLGCTGTDLHTKGSGYLEANVNYKFGSGYGLLLHYGHQRIKNISKLNFSDIKVGLSKTFDKGWTVGVNYTHLVKVYKPFYKGSPNPFPSLTGDGSASSPADDQYFVTIAYDF
jgi:hypothetical protein